MAKAKAKTDEQVTEELVNKMNNEQQSKEAPKSKEKRIVYVSFSNDQGEQLKHLNGAYLRYVQEMKKGVLSNNASDFHIVGIKEVKATAIGLTFFMVDGHEQVFPYNSIRKFTIE